MDRPLVLGFLKARNEVVREGNIYSAFKNLSALCDDELVVCDDASTDGTREYLQARVPKDRLILVPPAEQDFRKELYWKDRMMEIVHKVKPQWIFWADADEVLNVSPSEFRRFLLCANKTKNVAYRFRYTQAWQNEGWARTDAGFDDGSFIKLWRYHPDLSFDVQDGTHRGQFPKQIQQILDGHGQSPLVPQAPWEVIHFGNWGKNLQWKCIQYHGGLGGVPRHMDFEKATYRKIGRDPYPLPTPFSQEHKTRILNMNNLKKQNDLFTVVIPTYNRAWALPQTLQSLVDQTYQKWVAVVLDDGSTDNTYDVMREWQDKEPRIFYARYEKQGAVRLNEIGMDMACEFGSFWTRLGSDDYFEAHKLQRDYEALKQYDAVYGPYRVLRDGQLAEMCNPNMPPGHIKNVLTNGGFVVSWANIAVKTGVLAKVKEKYGNYCDPRLLNMEDFLVNSRIARFAEFYWRGVEGEHDAIWRVSADGASSNTAQTGNEDVLTKQLIIEENAKWT